MVTQSVIHDKSNPPAAVATPPQNAPFPVAAARHSGAAITGRQ